MLDKVRIATVGRLPGAEFAAAAGAVAESEVEPSTVPPLPVPLLRPAAPSGDNKYMRSQPYLCVTPAALPAIGTLLTIGGQARRAERFPLNSVIIDNMTVSWVLLLPDMIWTPPFVTGRVRRLSGGLEWIVRFETPPAVTAVAVVAGQVCRVQYSNEYLEEREGVYLPLEART